MELDKIYKKILIVDGSFLLHRVLSVPDIFDLRNSKGERTGGIFQFLRSLVREIQINGDYFPIVCFDKGLSKRRTNADKNYKHYNEHISKPIVHMTDSEKDADMLVQYRLQRNKIIQILSYVGIPALLFPEWEGDDLMYIISKMSESSLVITDDRDLLQLLSDSCNVRRPKADEVWDKTRFLKEGLKCGELSDLSDFVIYKSVIGDNSDNIPSSCAGVGEVTVGSFIPVLKHFSVNGVWDFSNYPKTESDMRALCVELDTKYRKAYLNFDAQRFLTNIELVDLSLVYNDISIEIIDNIKSFIYNSRNHVNYFTLIAELAKCEIKNIDVDTLMSTVKNRYDNLFI